MLKWGISIYLLVLVTGCFQKKYDYRYFIRVKNNTKDTLRILMGADKLTTVAHPIYRLLIEPNDSITEYDNILYSFKVNEGLKPVKYHLSTDWNFMDTVLVYRNDTLKCEWVAPAYDGELDDHNFFNYNAWKTWLINDEEGVIMFTIYPEDLKLNNK